MLTVELLVRDAADTGSTPWCAARDFSERKTFSADSFVVRIAPRVQSHVRTLKIPDIGSHTIVLTYKMQHELVNPRETECTAQVTGELKAVTSAIGFQKKKGVLPPQNEDRG